jgi:serine/threonine-protein kinase
MAEVRRGIDLRLDRQVAVKRLKTDLAADPAFQERFRREAHAVAILNHPGIAAVFDSGEQIDADSGVSVPYIVMEMVDGTTLRSILNESGSLPVRRALEITHVVLQALAHSHASGIVHRDIKPANIMVTPNGGIKVMDFGIARATETTSGLTGTSVVIGTAQYLSPEQAQGTHVDLRTDIYSTGCLLYELLTGRPPFVGESAVSLAYQHVREMPEPPSRLVPELGHDIDALLAKALAKDPAERYQSAAEMAADVDRILHGQPLLPAVPGEGDVDTRENPVVPNPQPAEEVESGATRSLPAAMEAAGSSATGSSVGAAALAASSFDSPSGATATVAEPSETALAAPLEPPQESRRSAGRTAVLAALTLLVLGGLLFGAYWLLSPGGERRVSVPSIQGKTRAEAETELREAELQVAFLHKRGPDNATRGTVVAQSPAPEAEVDRGSTVTAEINVGPATTKIPRKLVGRDLDEALEELADAGFTNVKAIPVHSPSEDADPDEVVAVDPAEGERAALEEDIVVSYVSTDARPATRGPTAGRAPTTRDRPSAEEESEDGPDVSDPAEESTRSSPPDDDETSTSDPTATGSSEPTETATSSPGNSEEPSGEASGDTDSAEGEGGTPVPSVSDILVGGENLPDRVESLGP